MTAAAPAPGVHHVEIVGDHSSANFSYVCDKGDGRDGFLSNQEALEEARRHAPDVVIVL